MSLAFFQDFRTSSSIDSFWTYKFPTGSGFAIDSFGGQKSLIDKSGSINKIGFAVKDHVTDKPWSLTIVSGNTGFTAFGFYCSFVNGQSVETACSINVYSPTSVYINTNNGTYNNNYDFSFEGLYTYYDLINTGVTLKITVTQLVPDEGSISGISTIVASFYTNESLSTEIATVTVGSIQCGDIWSVAVPNMSIGGPNSSSYGYTFALAKFTFESLNVSCIAQGSLISTSVDFKAVENLRPGDIVFDDYGKESLVVQLWKTKHPVSCLSYKIGKVTVSYNHHVHLAGHCWQFAHRCSTKTSTRKVDYYQVQTTSYGIRSELVAFSTWTDEYVKAHPHEMGHFIPVY